MITKTGKHQYFFNVQLNWQGDHKGILTALDVKDIIHVATPSAFSGGVPDVWSPEHLFLGALNSCFMTTYLAIADKKKFRPAHFECNAIGQIQVVQGVLEFTRIDLYPKVFVDNEGQKKVAGEILLKAAKHCIVANSIKTELIHHDEVLVEKHRIAS